MPYSRNPIDGERTYFETEGADGPAVVLMGGFLDSIDVVRETRLAHAVSAAGMRSILVDHRGLGRSAKPTDPAAYAMGVRVEDVTAVLDAAGVERAHFIGTSWGARLGFGAVEHAPGRLRSLVVGGQQPYAWPDSPLTRAVTEGLLAARTGGMEALVRAFEAHWDIEIPERLRSRYLSNDAVALEAAWTRVIAEGSISADLRSWQIPCFIFMGAGDVDFMEGARRAANEIPDSRFFEVPAADHFGAHIDQDERLLDEVVRWMRDADGRPPDGT